MKVLLAAVNAKYIHSNLAVHSLKAYARTYTEEIEVADIRSIRRLMRSCRIYIGENRTYWEFPAICGILNM